MFLARRLRHLGRDLRIGITKLFDEMALAGVVEPDLARSLPFRASLRFGHKRPYWKELHGAVGMEDNTRQVALRAAWVESGGVPEDIETEEEWNAFYCALDNDSTRRLWMEQKEVCRREGWG